jgi:predicted alpha-1,6-mannanase (GH76 family)
MACDLTRGRKIDCKDSIGGLKAIYICKAYSDNISAAATINTTEMTTAGFATWSGGSGSIEVFKYNLVANLSSLTVTTNSDNANGTLFFTQALSITLQKIDHDMTNELRLMGYSRAQIFVQDENDNVFLLGIDGGCHVSGGTVITGTAKGDLTGYTIEWGAEEKNAVIQLPASAGVATTKYPFDGLTDEADLTITEGS